MADKHTFKKQFGQNFLKTNRFPAKMIEILDIQTTDIVLEIGPGDGRVTKLLLESPAALVMAVEIDYQLIVSLVKRFNEATNFELINKDVLKLDFQNLAEEFAFDQNKEIYTDYLSGKYTLKIIGSLPYNISKPIIQLALTTWPTAAKMVYIVQEEVAANYVAQAPKASLLSARTQVFADVKKHVSIPPTQFHPQPKVNSSIIEFRPKPHGFTPEQLKEINKLTTIAYSSPRKTLRNNFKNVSVTLPEEIGSKRASEVDIVEVINKYILNA